MMYEKNKPATSKASIFQFCIGQRNVFSSNAFKSIDCRNDNIPKITIIKTVKSTTNCKAISFPMTTSWPNTDLNKLPLLYSMSPPTINLWREMTNTVNAPIRNTNSRKAKATYSQRETKSFPVTKRRWREKKNPDKRNSTIPMSTTVEVFFTIEFALIRIDVMVGIMSLLIASPTLSTRDISSSRALLTLFATVWRCLFISSLIPTTCFPMVAIPFSVESEISVKNLLMLIPIVWRSSVLLLVNCLIFPSIICIPFRMLSIAAASKRGNGGMGTLILAFIQVKTYGHEDANKSKTMGRHVFVFILP